MAALAADPAGPGAVAAGPDLRAVATLERLHAALNLGWSMAELRGRLRYGHCNPPGTVDYLFARERHALPLGGEHSLTEQLIATRVAVTMLAALFDVDRAPDGEDLPPSVRLRALAIELERALKAAEAASPDTPPAVMDTYPDGSAVGHVWSALTDTVYHWDEQIQDRFSVSVELLSAYQLGRGLAEIFWALDPDAQSGQREASDPPRPCSWEFLLSEHRRDLLAAQLKRLEATLPALTVPAVKGPLVRWCALVTSGKVRDHTDGPTQLRAQLQVWRDVLMGARNPVSLAQSFGIRVGARQFKRVLQAFGLEITLATISVAALALAGYYVGANKTSTGWTVVATILGFFGVTGAGLLARAKTQARALYVHLREAFYQDVISDKATILPSGVKR